MRASLDRRDFLGVSVLGLCAAATSRGAFAADATAGPAPAVLARPVLARPGRRKLRLGCVGVANRAADNLAGCQEEEIVALCDVDARHLAHAVKGFPAAKTYRDWRDLLARSGQDGDALDGVVVSTTDHTHAIVAASAMKRGLHVYCEKPLAHTVAEVRLLTELARERGLATQMGTQIHALPNYRRVVELVRSGAIGVVQNVDVWCGTAAWGGVPSPLAAREESPVPEHLDWDLWLGPAPVRPYVEGAYHPANWRRFWDFGGGNLADMGCHFIDLAFWALELGAPETVQAEGPPLDPDVAPKGLAVTWNFPAREGRPSVTLTWHDAGRKPASAAELGVDGFGSAVLFRGSEGFVVSDYHRHELGPKAKFAGFVPPAPSIPDSIGHYAEWFAAMRGEGRASCDFAYAGPLSECVLLGNVSYRLGGKRLLWQPDRLRAVNAPEAEGFLRRAYRDGWSL
jgi:predicted dehydrogenase